MGDTKEEGSSADDASCQRETTVQITPVGNNSSRDGEVDKVSVPNVYVNVVAEEEIAIEETRANKEDQSINMAEKGLAGEGQKDETVVIESPGETSSVSNACVDAKAADVESDNVESEL